MKILIFGDLHGEFPNIHFNDFDAIITPGDFCSDSLRKYIFKAMREGKDWINLLGKRKARKMIKKSLSDGRKVLEKLNLIGKPVFIVPGNWDWTGYKNSKWDFLKINHFKELISGLPNIKNTHFKLKTFKNYQIIGYGISSGPEPEKKFKKAFDKLSKLFKKATKPVIFLSHNVPFNTKIDKITNKESPNYKSHFGSLVVREIIEVHKPLISIGGHMHEHFSKCKVKGVISVDAGYGPDANILLELKNKKIKLKFFKQKKFLRLFQKI